MAREYIIKTTKYGREWKKMCEDLNFLEDNKKYRLEIHIYGLIQTIRTKISLKRNKRFSYHTY